MVTITDDTDYIKPLKPKIEIWNKAGTTKHYEFDGHLTNNSFPISRFELNLNGGDADSFSFTIPDVDNVLDPDKLYYSKIKILLGKKQSWLKSMMWGFVEEPYRILHNKYDTYVLSGVSTWAALKERNLFIKGTSKRANTSNSTQIVSTGKNRIGALIENYLADNDGYLIPPSIKNALGWSFTGINHSIDIPVYNYNFGIINAADFISRLKTLSGLLIYLDYSTGNEIFTMDYPSILDTNIILKLKYQQADYDNADAYKTAFVEFEGSTNPNIFQQSYDHSFDSGIRSLVIGQTISSTEKIFEMITAKKSTNLTNKAISQCIEIPREFRRINSITLGLSMTGKVESPKNRVNGLIVLDNGGLPTGDVIENFSIPLSDIEKNFELISIEVDPKIRFLTGVRNFIHIILGQRSGISGNPNSDTANAINWFHNNDLTTNYVTAGTPSYFAEVGEIKDGGYKKLTWKKFNNNGAPFFTVGIYSDINSIQFVRDSSLFPYYNQKEEIVDTSFLRDRRLAQDYIQQTLKIKSKIRQPISVKVKVPNDFVFRPYQTISVDMPTKKIIGKHEITNVRYIYDYQANIHKVETYLTLIKYYDPSFTNKCCIF